VVQCKYGARSLVHLFLTNNSKPQEHSSVITVKFCIHFHRSSYHNYIFCACIRYSQYLKYIQTCGKTKGRQWLQRLSAAMPRVVSSDIEFWRRRCDLLLCLVRQQSAVSFADQCGFTHENRPNLTRAHDRVSYLALQPWDPAATDTSDDPCAARN